MSMNKYFSGLSDNKYISRLTSSARGEKFNPLIYPFLITTLAYGLGFMVPIEAIVGSSVLFSNMAAINASLPFIWGLVSFSTVIMGITFLLFDIPPAGTYSGLLGFMVWFFVAILYAQSGDWLVLIAIAGPNAFFWIWQFLSVSRFRREDDEDTATLLDYNLGLYDDQKRPAAAKQEREDNRGMDVQSRGSYDEEDSGHDLSRPLDSA